eukprot:scaffold122853_cov37-Prasinocladus_malaysianus.AAC.1
MSLLQSPTAVSLGGLPLKSGLQQHDGATVEVKVLDPRLRGSIDLTNSDDGFTVQQFKPSGPEDGNWLGGQDQVVRQIEQLLQDDQLPLLAVCGGPGHGKSTVARAVASRLVARGFWVNSGTNASANLRMCEDPKEVVGHVAVAVGAITGSQRRRSRMSIADLTAYLRKHHSSDDEKFGVILDDVDYLILGEQRRVDFNTILTELLQSCPGLQIMLTAQQPLRVPGEPVPCVLVPQLGRATSTSVLQALTPGLEAEAAKQLASMSG